MCVFALGMDARHGVEETTGKRGLRFSLKFLVPGLRFSVKLLVVGIGFSLKLVKLALHIIKHARVLVKHSAPDVWRFSLFFEFLPPKCVI